MGLDESKIARPPRSAYSHIKLCVSAPVIPWRIIHQCPMDLWVKSHRESFNFPDKPMTCNYQMPHECTPAFCLSRQNIINFRKSCSVFSLRKRKRSSKMAEHFEYNHLPARLSSIQNLHFKSVLAIHSGLAVVHLARDLVTQFAVLDLRINKFLGTFGRQTVTVSTESTTGKISPDGCWCLIKLPSSRNRRVSILKLYDLRSCELLTELLLSPIPRLMLVPLGSEDPVDRGPLSQIDNTIDRFHSDSWAPHTTTETMPLSVHSTDQPVYQNGYQVIVHRSAPILYAFDPRFLNSRIAITNLNPELSDDDGPLQHSDESGVLKASVSLLKLPTWERIATSTKFKCSAVTSRPLSMSNPSRSHTANGQQNPQSSGGMLRSAPRRRRSSDVNHVAEPLIVSSNLPFPHVLNIFYSRDGYLLFIVSTDQRTCKCSSLGHLTSSSSSFCSSADSIDLMDDGVRNGTPNLMHRTSDGVRIPHPSFARAPEPTGLCYQTPEGSHHQSCTVLPRQSENGHYLNGGCHSASASPPPGCTALWLTIFNSDTLARLRTVRFDRAICPIHTCPTNYMPVMSRCGSRLAVLTNQCICQTLCNQRSVTAPVYCGDRDSTSSNNLRHSIPSVTVDVLTRTHFGGHRSSESRDSRSCMHLSKRLETSTQSVEINRTLATSSSSLPPFGRDDTMSHGNLGVANAPWSSSFPSPLVRVHFAESLTPARQANRVLSSDYQPSSTGSSISLSSVPVISSTGTSSMPASTSATLTSRRQIEVVLVYQLPPPPTLQALVRQRILQFCREEQLDRLDLPPQMISFLRFQPVFGSAGSYLSRSSSFTPTLRNVSLDRPNSLT
ncbi:hypothetical protein FGIG_02332 [Fasciola gigantica]|uniref:SOCS box domain-containing protein n=1 Tax=Fasciola gigantica TaxID=46835 RepID=A0A504YU16_FASGI|nr:hypothetical protein FGIG_02332 [Fasciola gigantica]